MSPINHKKFFLIIINILYFISIISKSYAQNKTILIEEINTSLHNWQPYKALKLVDEIKNLNQDDPLYFYFQAKINFYLGNYNEAKRFIDEVIKREKEWKGNKEIVRLLDLIESTIKATDGFFTEERGHFIIRFKEGKDRILINSAFLALEKSYEEIGSDLGYFPDKKVLVEIYPSIDSFISASGLPKKAIETSGTCALCNYNRILITSPRSTLRGYRWRDTLCHEYTHYIIYKIAGPAAPLWMHEGIAKYLERRWRQKTGRALDPSAEDILAKRIKENRLITFEEMTPSFAFLKTSQDVMLAFAQVMTLIEYFDIRGGMKSIRMLLENLTKGVSIETAVQEIFDMSFDDILIEWKQYLKKKGLKVWQGINIEELIFKDPEKEEDPSELELKFITSQRVKNFVKLGDMLKSRERPKAAIVEYIKAKLESKYLSPVLENKLAAAYYMSGETDKAKKILAETRNTFPNFVTTYVKLGSIYLKEEMLQDAKVQLEEAKDINPFNPWIYEGLIEIYKRLKQDNKAKTVLSTLKILIPDNPK